MTKFKYIWKNKEANFGKPLKRQIRGGTHVTFEIIPIYDGKIVAMRRKSIPEHESPPDINYHPRGKLFFCHNLIRYAEPMDKFVKRTVKSQTGVSIRGWKIVRFESSYQKKDGQWALLGYIIAKLSQLPKPGKYGNKVTEVVTFTQKNIPGDFAWWSKKELQNFMRSLE